MKDLEDLEDNKPISIPFQILDFRSDLTPLFGIEVVFSRWQEKVKL